MTEYLIPTPEYIIRGNRVKCTYCGRSHKTAAKYKEHFIRRHMNADGTWREAGKTFELPGDPYEQDEL